MCYYYCIGLSTISAFCVISVFCGLFFTFSTFALSCVTVTVCRIATVTGCTYPDGVFGCLSCVGFLVVFFWLDFFFLNIIENNVKVPQLFHSSRKTL